MFRFAGAVYHAAHDGHFHFFDTGVASLPDGHLVAQIRLNLLRHFLEESAGGTAASRARGYLGGEAANAEGLQNLLAYADFFGAIAAGSGGERDANRVADAFLHSTPIAALDATMPLAPMPASVSPRCRG